GETLCEQYARAHGLSVVCLRIPKPVALDDPHWKGRPIRPQWIAFPDLVRAYRLALTAPDVGFEVVTGVGDSTRRRWGLTRAGARGGGRGVGLEERGHRRGEGREPF